MILRTIAFWNFKTFATAVATLQLSVCNRHSSVLPNAQTVTIITIDLLEIPASQSPGEGEACIANTRKLTSTASSPICVANGVQST